MLVDNLRRHIAPTRQTAGQCTVTCGQEPTLTRSRSIPAKAVHQGHDLLTSKLEAFGWAVFRKVLDLLLREEDLQSSTETLSLHTTQTL